MNKHTIKKNALQAESSAVQLDICLAGLSGIIKGMKREAEKKDEVDYRCMFIGGIKDIIEDQIDHLFQIKHDLLLELKEEDRK